MAKLRVDGKLIGSPKPGEKEVAAKIRLAWLAANPDTTEDKRWYSDVNGKLPSDWPEYVPKDPRAVVIPAPQPKEQVYSSTEELLQRALTQLEKQGKEIEVLKNSQSGVGFPIPPNPHAPAVANDNRVEIMLDPQTGQPKYVRALETPIMLDKPVKYFTYSALSLHQYKDSKGKIVMPPTGDGFVTFEMFSAKIVGETANAARGSALKSLHRYVAKSQQEVDFIENHPYFGNTIFKDYADDGSATDFTKNFAQADFSVKVARMSDDQIIAAVRNIPDLKKYLGKPTAQLRTLYVGYMTKKNYDKFTGQEVDLDKKEINMKIDEMTGASVAA